MSSASISQALMDSFRLAQLIPVGRRTTVKTLVTALGGNPADRAMERKVQRQLERLRAMYPDDLSSDEANPRGWYWKTGSPIGLDFLTSDMAIALSLVTRYMQQLLPESTLKALKPLLEKSSVALDQADKAWVEKILVKRAGPARKPPSVDEYVQRLVYDALKRGDQLLEIIYKSRDDTKATRRTVWPLGLMLKNDLLYLVATKIGIASDEAETARWYALHRIQSVKQISPGGTKRRPEFSLEERDAAGWFNNAGNKGTPPKIELVLRVDPVAAVNLLESPLKDMTGKPELMSGGWVRIKASVQKTTDLMSWLRAYGQHAVVEEPLDLRDEMRAEARAMFEAYESPASEPSRCDSIGGSEGSCIAKCALSLDARQCAE